MPIISLNFTTLNVSIQETDYVYYCKTVNEQAGKNHPGTGSIDTKPKRLGIVTAVDRQNNAITVNTDAPHCLPCPAAVINTDHYILFGKDRRANHSGIIGYFTQAEYRNYSTLSAEIFATAVDYVESSK